MPIHTCSFAHVITSCQRQTFNLIQLGSSENQVPIPIFLICCCCLFSDRVSSVTGIFHLHRHWGLYSVSVVDSSFGQRFLCCALMAQPLLRVEGVCVCWEMSSKLWETVYRTPLAFPSFFPRDSWSLAGEKSVQLFTQPPTHPGIVLNFLKVPHGLPQHSILSFQSASRLSQLLLPPLAAVMLNNSHRLFSAKALREKRLQSSE